MRPNQVAEPHGDQAERHRAENVQSGAQPLALLGEVESLQAERGEGGVTAADANHEKFARGVASEPAAVWTGAAGENADEQRAADVGDECAPGKTIAPARLAEVGDPEAGDAPERTAEGDPNVCNSHGRKLVGRYRYGWLPKNLDVGK